jgi:hypothetical protein
MLSAQLGRTYRNTGPAGSGRSSSKEVTIMLFRETYRRVRLYMAIIITIIDILNVVLYVPVAKNAINCKEQLDQGALYDLGLT